MRSISYNNWVKNVYNLRTVGGITSGSVSTSRPTPLTYPYSHINNLLVLPSLLPSFFTQLSTPIFKELSLLIATYSQFPHPLLLLNPKEI